ncbi:MULTISPECIES: glycosyltransferase family 4 protein [Nocardiaceae]|uniref:glycosyltransferase family 4 protein n=1 Tax=Nocardiaceae TaxID=85025 RepID=UPI0015959BD8|nr:MULTISPECIES: glycosyltransferase family 4 protein [Rhodococcus]
MTTRVLQRQIPKIHEPRLLPAGIKRIERSYDGVEQRHRVVWAGRFNRDKNPDLFLEIMSTRDLSRLTGIMYGTGPLKEALSSRCSNNVAVGEWVAPERLWDHCLVYLGTSHREAFGRSAVEAAMSGIPVVLSNSFGAAELLITDSALAERFILPNNEPDRWIRAIVDLYSDPSLRAALSDHVFLNAQKLTIQSSVAQIVQRVPEIV